MKYNIIGADLSLASAGVFIKTKNNEEHYFNYKNNNKTTKWHKLLNFVNYNEYVVNKTDNFSLEQVEKIKKYDEITDKIIMDILSVCIPEESIVVMESYSYSSMAGPLIDLVSYSTLLRSKLIKLNFELYFVPPTSLKANTAKLVYGPGKITGKKKKKEGPAKNKLGIAGGAFKKQEIFLALCESNLKSKVKDKLLPYKKELWKMKSIPSPISDIIDAIFLVETIHMLK